MFVFYSFIANSCGFILYYTNNDSFHLQIQQSEYSCYINFNQFVSPFIMDKFVDCSQYFFSRHIMSSEFLCNTAAHNAMYII